MAYKKWVIRDADKERASELSEKFNIDPFIAFLLVSRGIDDDITVSGFLSDSFEAVSPFNFADMEEAAFTVGDAIDNGSRICIYGDYDCDGITSTALLYLFLQSEGADCFYYIPERNDGYGLNKSAIDEIKNKGAELIITVDNGISSVDEAEYIYSLGMSLVITDHHQIGDELPRAEAIINPYREENNLQFRDYCGVGVAFKLVCALYEGEIDDLLEQYIDLVAIGTIADVVPLVGENRAFVRAGLKRINTSPRSAVKAFALSMNKSEYTANDIAFMLCPRLNAVGRMDSASKAVEFLISENMDESVSRCELLNTENAHRQEVEKNILDDIEKKIAKNPKLVLDRVIVIDGKDYHHGVIGIVASHILERYSKPVFVIGVDENKIARGSARSFDGFNLFEAISACQDDLIRFGGHTLAAGVTLEEGKIDDFRRHINEYALSRYTVMPAPRLTLDCKISPNYLNLDLVESLSVLEPYGAGNPQAVFAVTNMCIVGVTPLSEGKHIRLELERRGRRIRAVKFGVPFNRFPYSAGDTVDIAVKVSKNFYRDKNYLSIQIVDIKLSNSDDEKYFSEKNSYELFRLNAGADVDIYPDRESCAVIYKYIKSMGGYRFGRENLYLALQNRVTYGQVMLALHAFSQAGLVNINGDEITLNEVKNKVALEDTQILKSVRERLLID